MQNLMIRDSKENIIATVYKVLTCETSDRLEGERTLRFSTLMENGLENLQEEEKYTVEFEEDFFDVASFQKSMSGNLCIIDISCEHISYRLNDYTLENFSCTGKVSNILSAMLIDTGFTVGQQIPVKTLTYSSQQSATVRAILLDFASSNGWDVDFRRRSISLLSHKGTALDTKILHKNVLEISKTVSIAEGTAAYSLQLKPNTPVGVGDEVHLVFERLGINDKVRVLGIKRQPFISENITLEVGAYEPSLASDAVQVITNMVSQNETYYGTRISADNGLEINRGDGQARVVFNADKMAFYQGEDEILFFDPVERKWKMSASVEIHINDKDGNDTTMTALANGLTTRIQDADDHFIEISETINGLTVKTSGGETLIDGGMIITDNLQLHRLIAKDSPNSFVEMMANGLNFVLGNANTIGIGYASSDVPLPYMIFGEGASPKTDAAGMIKFYSGGLWLGDSADRHSTTISAGTGLFVDVPNDKVYIYINGEGAEISNQKNVAELIAKLKDYVDGITPVAVFG